MHCRAAWLYISNHIVDEFAQKAARGGADETGGTGNGFRPKFWTEPEVSVDEKAEKSKEFDCRTKKIGGLI
jgi:hypothetical protein